MDTIRVPAIPLLANLPGYAWSPDKASPQPILVTATIKTNVSLAGAIDNLDHTISYSDLPKIFTDAVAKPPSWQLLSLAQNLHALADKECKATAPPGYQVNLRIEQSKALLHAANAGIDIGKEVEVFIDEIHISTIIGVRPHERKTAQVVLVSVKAVPLPEWNWKLQPLEQAVIDHIESNHPLLIEAMLQSLANKLLAQFPFSRISLTLAKPAASRFGGPPEVTVTRSRPLPHTQLVSKVETNPDQAHIAFIAFGSNLGQKKKNIETALSLLDTTPGCTLLDTSHLYNSKPMYYEAQDDFLNGVVKISTSLSPVDLLATLKRIEKDLGRNKTIDNGPREVDLDIILYDDLQINDEQVDLKIPHIRLHEREFVLRPLADIAPHIQLPHLFATPLQLLSRFSQNSELHQILPLPLRKSSTTIMAILNLTPDSFATAPSTLESSLALAKQHIEEGATILDLGGMSTRPGASGVSQAEEIERVVPFITLLRQQEWAKDVILSVDTFRAEVAEQALAAGANWINDVKAGAEGDGQAMFEIARKGGAPIVLMHSRGDAQSMNGLAKYDGDVVEISNRELAERVQAALDAGVKRWQIVIDPGIGFAKNAEANWEMIRGLAKWRKGALAGFPVLFGCSRKRFLGSLIEEPDASQRDGATAATLVEAVRAGCEVVRVHHTRSARDAVKVADCMYK